jgi:ProP effector
MTRIPNAAEPADPSNASSGASVEPSLEVSDEVSTKPPGEPPHLTAEAAAEGDARVVTDPPTRPGSDVAQAKKQGRLTTVQPVLEKLFELYPHLFGAEFLPLKLGIFQELLAKHPEHFQRDTLKAALGVHARSGRYLQSVAARRQRHGLDGAAVEDVAPEHIYLAIVELFRRRQARSNEDLRPRLRAQLMTAFAASGLTSQAYLAKIPTGDADTTAVLQDALAEHDQKLARQEALVKAFEASGKTPEEFAGMYGLHLRDVAQALAQHRKMQGSVSA